jgi:hypothetical protein
MSEVLFFNPSNLHQQFVDTTNQRVIDKLLEAGWVRNPRLIHMHNPVMQDDKLVLIADRPTWENKGYYAEPTYVYHPTEGAKVVPAEQAKKMLNQGYFSNPNQFPGTKGNGEANYQLREKLVLPKGAA